MIHVHSYQVYDNCVGDCVVPQVKCELTAQDKKALDDIRWEIGIKHRDDVIQYKKQHHIRLTEKESSQAIMIYLTYTEK